MTTKTIACSNLNGPDLSRCHRPVGHEGACS